MHFTVETDPHARTDRVEVVLCVDRDAHARLAPIIRHLSVGLVDLAGLVRVLTSAPDSEDLSLGPLQTLVYQEPVWPLRRQRLRQIIDVIEPRPPNLVHAISAGALPVARSLAGHFGAPLVLQLTSFDDVDALPSLALADIDHLICASDRFVEPVAHTLETAGRARSGRIPRTSLIRPGLLAGAEPGCFADPTRVPTLLCTTRMEPGTGVDLVLHAAARVTERGYETMFFLLGAGSVEPALRRLAQRLGLTTRVTFARAIADPAAIMSGADVYVQPEVERAIWAKPLQAMAAGLAVITPPGCACDAYVDGQAALICRERSGDGLAECIESLLTDREHGRRLAAGAQDYLRKHHAMSAMAQQTLDIYHGLILSRRTFALKNPSSA